MHTVQTVTVNLEDYAGQRRPQLGAVIRRVRQQKGWTQEQVAAYLGCSRRRVNRVEQGITEFSLFELELLAQGLGTPVARIIEPV